MLNIRRTKSKQINIRTTEIDHARIKKRAESAGRSITEYLTTLALYGKVVIVPGWQDAAKELSAIGNNLNQLTRLCHERIITCPELSGTKEEIAKVWQLLNSQAVRKG